QANGLGASEPYGPWVDGAATAGAGRLWRWGTGGVAQVGADGQGPTAGWPVAGVVRSPRPVEQPGSGPRGRRRSVGPPVAMGEGVAMGVLSHLGVEPTTNRTERALRP